MHGLSSRRMIGAVLVFAGLWAGCGGPSGTPLTVDEAEKVALLDMGELLRVYQTQNKKPPASLQDLAPMEQISQLGYPAAQRGDIVVFWNVTLPDTNEEPGQSPDTEVLAYNKNVPEKGGYVLLKNRTAQLMTADEFKAAAKAGKTP